MRNIVLIGMPGAGKSTIGVLLAKTIGMPFVDTDLLIQQREKTTLQEIITKKGLIRFLSIEEQVILSLQLQEHVIATGGSVVYSNSAIEHLKSSGMLVYLELSFNQIEKRIKNIKTRGIAMNEGQSLLDIYRQRTPLYERYADITIDCSNKDVESVIMEICEKVKKI